MKVDIQDVLFWMDAIRNSDDKYRTLESFWKGQVNSKIWLAEQLYPLVSKNQQNNIVIYGGWNGVLASILFNSYLPLKHITSVDIDEACQETAYTVNKNYEIAGRFDAVTADMCTYTEPADIVINTSCEHITQEQYEQWLDIQPDDALFVVQSNNYFELVGANAVVIGRSAAAHPHRQRRRSRPAQPVPGMPVQWRQGQRQRRHPA